VILASSSIQQMGVDEAVAALRFGEAPKPKGAWAGRRLLWLGSEAAFELTFWCGTCPFLFQRLEGATSTLSIAELENRLSRGLTGIDSDVLAAFAELLPATAYLPILLQVTPRLVTPVAKGDYFAHEQVATWGLNNFWGLPENPRTPYYRTFETAVTTGSHLYEFVVPMVPPTDRPTLTMTEIARELDVPAPTAHRIARTLETQGYLTRDPVTRAYGLGPEIQRLFGLIAETAKSTLDPATLIGIRNATGETVGLHIRVSDRRVCVIEHVSPEPTRVISGYGRSYSLGAGAAGKAILSLLLEDEVQRLVALGADPGTTRSRPSSCSWRYARCASRAMPPAPGRPSAARSRSRSRCCGTGWAQPRRSTSWARRTG
jgi:hypothetical protein